MVGTGQIRRFVPVFDPCESEERELFMTPALHDWLYQADRKATENFKANIRAFLGRYVKGEEIDNRDYMKSWKLNVFELRVQLQPRREATRIFGAFAATDVFFASNWHFRSDFGDATDPKWDAAIERLVKKWDELFAGYHRVAAKPFSNCVAFKGINYE